MEVPDWQVTDAISTYAARWAASLSRLMSSLMVRSIWLAVLAAILGMAGQDREKRGVGEQFLDLPGDVHAPVAQPSDIGGELGG